MVDKFRKWIALLSVLLLLMTVRCMAACTASDDAFSGHADSAQTPPCHRHQGPAKGTQGSAPCQNHPGMLAYSFQPCAHVDLHVNTVAVVYAAGPAFGRWIALTGAAYAPPPMRPPILASLVLRI